MKKVFYLGLHKTGSTSLQLFLQHNQQTLAKRKILFPPTTPDGFAQFQSEARGHAPPQETPKLNTFMGHNALAYQMIAEAIPGFDLPAVHAPMPDAASVFRDIQGLIKETQAETLVFCSEDLARASLMAPLVPTQFADTFGQEDATIIAAIRRPDDAIAAWQGQRLNFGTPFPALRSEAPTSWLGSVHMDYEAALRPWLHAFPTASLHILPYPDLRQYGGSVQAFEALCGSLFPQNLHIPADANISLPYALMEIARLGYDSLPRQTARHLHRFLDACAPKLTVPANSEVDLFTQEMRDILYRGFQSTHDWLSQITGRLPFFADLDAIRTPRPMTEQDAARQALPHILAHAADTPPSPDILAFLKDLHDTGLHRP